MATASRQSGGREQSAGSLQPFHGLFVPGIAFESGHSIWLYDFVTTPTPEGGYDEIWLVMPDGERILLVEREAIGAEVARYHEFDRTVLANVEWTWTGRDDLHLDVDTTDGTELALDVELDSTPAARTMGAMSRLTPAVVGRSTLGLWMTNASLNGLLGLGGLRAAGHTETGRRYRGEPDRIALTAAVSATLDGADLGSVVTSSEPVTFGDIRLTARPVFFFGDLYMEYPDRSA